MNFLKWYTPIVISLSIVLLLPDMAQGGEDALWGIILYAPACVYTWLIATRK